MHARWQPRSATMVLAVLAGSCSARTKWDLRKARICLGRLRLRSSHKHCGERCLAQLAFALISKTSARPKHVKRSRSRRDLDPIISNLGAPKTVLTPYMGGMWHVPEQCTSFLGMIRQLPWNASDSWYCPFVLSLYNTETGARGSIICAKTQVCNPSHNA